MANGAASNQFGWLFIQPTCWLAGRCQTLCEASLHRKLLASLQHVEASTCELVGHRFDGHYAVSFGFLSLIKFTGGFAVTYRKIRWLDICPCEKVVAVLGIAFALILSVGDMDAADAATIRCVIPRDDKSTDIASFQQNESCQDRSDACYRAQQRQSLSRRQCFDNVASIPSICT